MMRIVLLRILPCLFFLPGVAFANFLDEDPDCAFFEYSDLGGAYWTSHTTHKDPFSAALGDWWNDRASSVWVKQGYVFEAYADLGFKGYMLSITTDDYDAHRMAGGAYINFFDKNFMRNLSSFRCRPAGATLSTDEGLLQWMEGARYLWRSAGNHPHQKWLEMKRLDGDFLIILHSDHTYGVNQEDYVINLSQKTVRVNMIANGFARAELSFDFWMSTFQDQFGIYFGKIADHIAMISQGYYYPNIGAVEPPKPELQTLVKYMQQFSQRNQFEIPN